jgi:hypothetical protein
MPQDFTARSVAQAFSSSFSEEQGKSDAQLLLTGDVASLRFLFAKIRVIECNRDFSPSIGSAGRYIDRNTTPTLCWGA